MDKESVDEGWLRNVKWHSGKLIAVSPKGEKTIIVRLTNNNTTPIFIKIRKIRESKVNIDRKFIRVEPQCAASIQLKIGEISRDLVEDDQEQIEFILSSIGATTMSADEYYEETYPYITTTINYIILYKKEEIVDAMKPRRKESKEEDDGGKRMAATKLRNKKGDDKDSSITKKKMKSREKDIKEPKGVKRGQIACEYGNKCRTDYVIRSFLDHLPHHDLTMRKIHAEFLCVKCGLSGISISKFEKDGSVHESCEDIDIVLRKLSSIQNDTVPHCLFKELNIPHRQLFGPGPSTMPPVIGSSQAQPLLGHLHPEFVEIMSQVRLGLQYIFKTRNAYTFAISGTGHAGMEAAILNLAERGETLLVAKAGIWGERAANVGRRLGLNVEVIEVGDGQIVPVSAIEEAASRVKPALIFVCHGESSTGIVQPLEGLSKIAHDNGGLLLVDTVASLGGAPFNSDALGVDCVYSATQKVLNGPPGLSPISFSDRAIEKIKNRKEKVASFYFDALELGNYWGCDGEMKRYHHTAPISSVYALREALAIVAKKGIDVLIQQHIDNATLLYNQLGEAGISMFVENKSDRLPCLHTIKVPEGVDWKAVQANLFGQGIEVAGGLGATTEKIFRIGTFGQNSEPTKAKEIINKFIQVVKEQSKL